MRFFGLPENTCTPAPFSPRAAASAFEMTCVASTTRTKKPLVILGFSRWASRSARSPRDVESRPTPRRRTTGLESGSLVR